MAFFGERKVEYEEFQRLMSEHLRLRDYCEKFTKDVNEFAIETNTKIISLEAKIRELTEGK